VRPRAVRQGWGEKSRDQRACETRKPTTGGRRYHFGSILGCGLTV
jgi:hypothetical protein